MEGLFRKESEKRIESPDVLSDYLHVASPATWAVLAAVVLLLAGLFVWSSVTAVESFATGTAEVQSGVLTLHFDDAEKAGRIEAGMEIKVGGVAAPVLSVGTDAEGRPIAVAEVKLPDGTYEAGVGYRSTTIIDMLFN
ncbi:MAG: hypothetical protein IJU18_02290 [Oscillospiraceae bacterium]|nr:hypothetical protein [Oscillospiraceae bacterium]